MYSYGSPHTAAQKQDDQHERTFSSYVRIQVVVLKTYLGRWTIGRSGERGSGISVLPARYDDDDDDDIYVFYFCIYSGSLWYIDNYVSLQKFPSVLLFHYINLTIRNSLCEISWNFLFIKISKSEVGDSSRGWPKGSLFDSYNTRV